LYLVISTSQGSLPVVSDQWKQRNNDKLGHTPEEVASIERDNLFIKAAGRFKLKNEVKKNTA
jgi:hypothetical protein